MTLLLHHFQSLLLQPMASGVGGGGWITNSFTKNQYLWVGILCQVGWIPLSRLLHVGQEAEGDLRWDVRELAA